MKVCFLVYGFPFYKELKSIEEYILDGYKNHEIDTIIFTDHSASNVKYTKSKIYRSNLGFFNVKTMIKFAKVLKDEKVDVVQIFDLRPSYLLLSVIARILRKKVIMSCVGKISVDQNFIFRALATVTSNKLTVLTDNTRKSFFIKNIMTMYNGVDEKRFFIKQVKKEKQIITVGRIDPIKNYELLIRAAKDLPDYKFLIIGPTYSKKYENKIKTMLKTDNIKNVFLKGPVPNEKLVDYYNKSMAFVLTSTYEMFPSVILEACACGLPVLASNIPNIREILDDEMLIDIENHDDLTQKLRKLLGDNKTYQKYSVKSQKIADKYSMKHMQEKYTNLIKSVLND